MGSMPANSNQHIMRIVRYNYPSYRSLVRFPADYSRSPWSGFESEINRLFSAVAPSSASQFPVDLYEDEGNAYVRAELPGVSRDDIQVEMTDGNLSITATRKIAATESQAGQSFSLNRSLAIPADVSGDQVTAAYENGVLTVTLPKREEAKPKKITVEVK
ncbi:MAG: heat shock protein Hsp20 [Verrucomicrobia bacterium]|nr:heat shock protein Hsp20 [Verrucomicrobiota bacterium]